MIFSLMAAALLCFAGLTYYRATEFTKRAEHDTPPVGRFIVVDGTRVHYLKRGTGPALLMIHGAGGHLKDFTFDLFDRLAKDFTVIAIDRPGHGYSQTLATSGATLAQQSQLIFKTAKKLGVNQAFVLGFSYGGAVSLNMATQNPAFVKGLILVSAVSMPWPNDINATYRLMSKPVIGPISMAISTAYFGDNYFLERYRTVFAPHAAPNGFLEHVGVNMSVRYKSFVENSRQLNTLRPQIVTQSKLYKNLRMPIELIHGAADTSVPARFHAKEFIKIVPQAHLVVVDGIGHGTHQLAIPQIEAAIHAVSGN